MSSPKSARSRKHVEEVLKREEEAFNKTLDKGIALFEAEVSRLVGARDPRALGSATAPVAMPGASPGTPQTKDADSTSDRDNRATDYYRRRLPHFERAWAKYMVTFSTDQRRVLAPAERDIVLETILHDHGKKYELYAACVMPDHVHILLEPAVKERDDEANPTFHPLPEILATLKSVSAHRINKSFDRKGQKLWGNESYDRLIRSEQDLEEKFLYICNNPRNENLTGPDENYQWLWYPGVPTSEDHRNAETCSAGSATAPVAVPGASPGTPHRTGAPLANDPVSTRDVSGEAPATAGGAPALPKAHQAAATISAAFAFRLYDEQGFPLDLTELMARERGFRVDTAGFGKLMDEQRARARAAQKKQVIELSEIETKEPTHFLGYDHDHIGADVTEVLNVKGRTVVILNNSVCYAEMGGQVGDTGEMTGAGRLWRIANTQKSGPTWLHFLEESDAPAVGDHVTVQLDRARRAAIQRHHSVTHLLHWALHEVVSHEATQKGSFVGPEKLTFDFNSPALSPAQVRDVEQLVNERILENAPVYWTEMPYSEVKGRPEVLQFFGDKYGERVRVVQIGGEAGALNGYSMELCGGTHARHTGEIGLFRIAAESAIAAGVRRIEAVAGLPAYASGVSDAERLRQLAARLGAPLGELEKKLEAMLGQQKELEKQLESLRKKQATAAAGQLLHQAVEIGGTPTIIEAIEGAGGDELQTIADALKGLTFRGVVFLAGVQPGQVALVASVSPDYTVKYQAGKLIQLAAPMVGGKGGGRPDSARGAGKDTSKVGEALGKVRAVITGE